MIYDSFFHRQFIYRSILHATFELHLAWLHGIVGILLQRTWSETVFQHLSKMEEEQEQARLCGKN